MRDIQTRKHAYEQYRASTSDRVGLCARRLRSMAPKHRFSGGERQEAVPEFDRDFVEVTRGRHPCRTGQPDELQQDQNFLPGDWRFCPSAMNNSRLSLRGPYLIRSLDPSLRLASHGGSLQSPRHRAALPTFGLLLQRKPQEPLKFPPAKGAKLP
jgi:hypothetical protein